MWIVTVGGFFSIVQTSDPRRLVVRARAAADLDYFRRHCPALGPTLADPYADYRYRAFGPRRAVQRAVAALVQDITYSNFKAAAPPERHDVYMDVWFTLARIQNER
jgi:hypothetical protein